MGGLHETTPPLGFEVSNLRFSIVEPAVCHCSILCAARGLWSVLATRPWGMGVGFRGLWSDWGILFGENPTLLASRGTFLAHLMVGVSKWAIIVGFPLPHHN